MHKQRWIIRIDNHTDEELAFYGWLLVERGDEFSLYERPYDGEQQVVSNDPPRWFSLDDFNDAQQMVDPRFAFAIEGPPSPAPRRRN